VKNFVIPGSPKDYYVAMNGDGGVVEYSALRGKIRQLVEIYNSCIREIINEGGNHYTASLDMTDIVNDFMSKEPPEAQVAFLNVFSQEMNAATSETIDKTNRLNAETAKREAGAMQAGQWIGAIILFFVILAFFMY